MVLYMRISDVQAVRSNRFFQFFLNYMCFEILINITFREISTINSILNHSQNHRVFSFKIVLLLFFELNSFIYDFLK